MTPAGFWLDEHPIPDVFAMELPDLAAHLFHDPQSPMAQMFTTLPEDMKLLEEMYVERVKRFTQASKFLWPIPDRGLKKRAWRIAAPTLVMMGESDRLIPPGLCEGVHHPDQELARGDDPAGGPHADV